MMVDEAERLLDHNRRLREGDSAIEALNKSVRSLTNRVGRLTTRMESLELLDFQQQPKRLNNDLTIVGNELLAAERYGAANDISVLTTDLLHFLSNLSQSDQRILPAREFALRLSAAALQQLQSSPTPMATASEYRGRLVAYCKNAKLVYFLEG